MSRKITGRLDLPDDREQLVERRLTYTLLDVKRGISAVIAMLVLIAPSAAWAGKAFDEVLKDYRGDANINACKHSEKTLRKAQQETPNDIKEFAPDFTQALGNAISARAQGACEGKAFRRVFKDYHRDGEISPCRHTLRELRVALRQTPDDIKQTAPGFPAELRRSIKERRHDRCGDK